jgi:hypothetical protein
MMIKIMNVSTLNIVTNVRHASLDEWADLATREIIEFKF